MPRKYNELIVPNKIRLNEYDTHIEVVRIWFSRNFILPTIFFIYLDYGIIKYLQQNEKDIYPLDFFTLWIILWGVLTTYPTLAGLLNRTYISVDPLKIIIRHFLSVFF